MRGAGVDVGKYNPKFTTTEQNLSFTGFGHFKSGRNLFKTTEQQPPEPDAICSTCKDRDVTLKMELSWHLLQRCASHTHNQRSDH